MQTIDEMPATPTAATSQPRPAAPAAKRRFPVSTRNLAAWAITAQVLFALSWIVAGWAQPTYSHLDQAISDLAARHARYPGILMVGMLVFGSGLVALAIALRRTVGVRARLGIGVLLAAAALMPVSAFARVDCATSSAACRARVAADIESGQQSLHNLGGLLLFVLLCVSMLVWARAFRRSARWSDLRIPSIVAGLSAFGLLVVAMGVDGSRHWSGIAERVFILVPMVWIGVVAARADRSGEPAAGPIVVGSDAAG